MLSEWLFEDAGASLLLRERHTVDHGPRIGGFSPLPWTVIGGFGITHLEPKAREYSETKSRDRCTVTARDLLTEAL
jgi:hypothetical protein